MRVRSILIVSFILLLSPATNGTSFDCEKSSIEIEIMICTDSELSQLDERLGEIYEKTKTKVADVKELREDQLLWLRNERNVCESQECLTAAYDKRIEALQKMQWLTNEESMNICQKVNESINNGSIINELLPLHRVDYEQSLKLKAKDPIYKKHGVQETIEIDYDKDGRIETLGRVIGSGSCRGCGILDLNAPVTSIYPKKDPDDDLRWSGWGECDQAILVDDRLIIVTGNFRSGAIQAGLVSWLDNEGIKRPLCYLEESDKLKVEVMMEKNNALCNALIDDKVKYISWSEGEPISRTELRSHGIRGADSSMVGVIDLDSDGKDENIMLIDYAHGGGCGSYHQWLVETSQESPSLPESLLNNKLKAREWGPINRFRKPERWFSANIFQYDGQPYVLGRGVSADAEVISLWSGKYKTWCQYEIFPQHSIKQYYPVEEWSVK